MQGEKEQKGASGRSTRAAEGTAFQGPGRSRNTASAWPASAAGRPCASTSRTRTVTRPSRPLRRNSSLQQQGGRATMHGVDIPGNATTLLHILC